MPFTSSVSFNSFKLLVYSVIVYYWVQHFRCFGKSNFFYICIKSLPQDVYCLKNRQCTWSLGAILEKGYIFRVNNWVTLSNDWVQTFPLFYFDFSSIFKIHFNKLYTAWDLSFEQMVLHCIQQYAIGAHDKSFLSILKNVYSHFRITRTIQFHDLYY